MKQHSLTRLMHDAKAQAILEPFATAAIRAVATPPKMCVICCHERGVTIPLGVSGCVCGPHRDSDMREQLATALDEMAEEGQGAA